MIMFGMVMPLCILNKFSPARNKIDRLLEWLKGFIHFVSSATDAGGDETDVKMKPQIEMHSIKSKCDMPIITLP